MRFSRDRQMQDQKKKFVLRGLFQVQTSSWQASETLDFPHPPVDVHKKYGKIFFDRKNYF
jgi:hypothetical protein